MSRKVKKCGDNQITGRKELASHLGVKEAVVTRWIELGMPLIQKGTMSRVDRVGKRYIFHVPDVFRWVMHNVISPQEQDRHPLNTNRNIWGNHSASLLEASGGLLPHISEDEMVDMLGEIAEKAYCSVPPLAFEAMNRSAKLELTIKVSLGFVDMPEEAFSAPLQGKQSTS